MNDFKKDNPHVWTSIASITCRAEELAVLLHEKKPTDESVAKDILDTANDRARASKRLLDSLDSRGAGDMAKRFGWRDAATLRRFLYDGIPPTPQGPGEQT
ncbi:MAG: hypothetical protein OXD40_09505 [bacterium]|nr:hypothetical protein [bacterium]